MSEASLTPIINLLNQKYKELNKISISTFVKSTKEIIKRQVIDDDIILTLSNGLSVLVDRKEYNLYSLQTKIKKVC